MLTTRFCVAVALAASMGLMGCEKSIEVQAVSVSDATGKTVALDGDPSAVYLVEQEMEMPVEVAFRATGQGTTTGRALELDDFNMAPKASPNCAVTKLGSCSGEVCTAIVRWNEPGFCAFRTRVTDVMGHEASSCREMYVGMDEATEKKAVAAFEGGRDEERKRRCGGD
ncbi:MAG: hypothetical protein ACQEVA_20265 [Myxococcota bacterium]